MITGSSTHNQRIKRLLRDTHRSVTTLYYHLFYFLESQGLLDPLNDMHIFALHYVYLPRISRALTIFKQGWNHHGIRTAGHHSPHQLFVSGALRLHSSGLHAVDFFSQVGVNYGIDQYETIIPTPEDNTVTVPDCRIVIPDTDMERLQQEVNPLAHSDNYGIELYEQVVEILEDVLTCIIIIIY